MDSQLKAQCQQVIYVARIASRTAAGDPVFGTPTAIRCRCEVVTSSRNVSGGEGKSTSYWLVTDGCDEVQLTDRVWLPGVNPTTSPDEGRTPFQLQAVPDENGRTDHYEFKL